MSETLADAADPAACFQALYDHFARSEAWRVHSETGPTLHALAERGCPIGLASNFDGRLRGVAAGLPELRPVRSLVISAEVGWRKPAAAFFDEVRRQAGLPADQIVFVGDDPVNDYDGARAAGLAAVLFDPRGEVQDRTVRRGAAERTTGIIGAMDQRLGGAVDLVFGREAADGQPQRPAAQLPAARPSRTAPATA